MSRSSLKIRRWKAPNGTIGFEVVNTIGVLGLPQIIHRSSTREGATRFVMRYLAKMKGVL